MKLRVGDKVILKSKYDEDLSNSAVYRRITDSNQPYAYITKIETSIRGGSFYVVSEVQDGTGDFFLENDVESYLKEERKNKLKQIQNGI